MKIQVPTYIVCSISNEYFESLMTIDHSLKFNDHIRRAADISNGLATNIFSSTLSRETDFLINIYESHIRPQLEYIVALFGMLVMLGT